jgi:Protein of unknown function (DUF1559)
MKSLAYWLAAWACLTVLIGPTSHSVSAEPPAAGAAREFANRSANSHKLNQIALAMHSYSHRLVKADGAYKIVTGPDPARAIFDGDGKPLLSWRVAILPFHDEKELYDQFHLDEPWDSEHNKPLIGKMPDMYAKAGRKNEGKTVFLVPVGKGLAFEGDKGITEDSITDGMDATIIAVEANDEKAVIWTKPDDLDIDPKKLLDGLGDAEAGGLFGVAFFDGSTKFLSKSIDPKILMALFTRAGGERVDPQYLAR